MSVIPFDHIESTDIIRKTEEFLRVSTGMAVKVLEYSGGDLSFSCSSAAEKKNVVCHETIEGKYLNRLNRTRAPIMYRSPSGHLRILVPILLERELAGLFFLGMGATCRMKESEVPVLLSYVEDLCKYVVQNETAFLRSLKKNSTTVQGEVLRKALRYIQQHADSNELTLGDVARHNGISYSYLSRLFKAEMKTTFVEYRQQVRMERAARLLTDHRMTVDQVALACGFEDSSYFCKSFKKVYGDTATSYRRRFLSEPGPVHAPGSKSVTSARPPQAL